MNLINMIILGLFQGLAEFLPVSSSGHLVLFQELLNIKEPAITIDVFLHLGTLMSVIVVFRKDILKLLTGFFKSLNITKKESSGYGKLAWLIILANIPAGLAGILLGDYIEHFFKSSTAVFMMLIVTGIILFIGKFCKADKYNLNNIGIFRAFIIGIGQMLSILPGISRSGTTITTGMLLKVKREDAARFSFFIMLPAVAGATLLEFLDINSISINYAQLAVGVLVAFISGYIAIKLLLKLVKEYKLHYFAYYCVLVGLIGLLFSR